MNRIDECFKKLKDENRKGFFPFIVAGYPDIQTTEKLIVNLERMGADLIELGVPFSDPIADGPIIQEASYHALLKGVNLNRIFLLVKKLREKVKIPIVLMSYYNPVLKFGLAKTAKIAKSSGVDGFIIPDLNVKASFNFKNFLQEKDLRLIYFISINSLASRVKLIAGHSNGFIYLVSHLGVTGESTFKFGRIQKMIKDIRQYTDTKIAIGFGISGVSQARNVLKYGDAVIIGSKIIKIIKNNKGAKLIKEMEGFVKKIKRVL